MLDTIVPRIPARDKSTFGAWDGSDEVVAILGTLPHGSQPKPPNKNLDNSAIKNRNNAYHFDPETNRHFSGFRVVDIPVAEP